MDASPIQTVSVMAPVTDRPWWASRWPQQEVERGVDLPVREWVLEREPNLQEQQK